RLAIRQVMIGGEIHDFDPAVVEPRVRVKPGARVGLHTQDERPAVWTVNVRVPGPVPEELVVSVPLRDDSRVRAPVFRIVDRATGAPLPRALLEPGPGAVALQPLPADEQGRIRVPAGVPERLAAAWRNVGASFAAADHEPRGYGGLFGRGESDAEQ